MDFDLIAPGFNQELVIYFARVNVVGQRPNTAKDYNLYIETEMHHISILHDVFFAFNTQFTRFTTGSF